MPAAIDFLLWRMLLLIEFQARFDEFHHLAKMMMKSSRGEGRSAEYLDDQNKNQNKIHPYVDDMMGHGGWGSIALILCTVLLSRRFVLFCVL